MTDTDKKEEEAPNTPAWLKCAVVGEAETLEALGVLLMDLGAGGVEEKAGSIQVYFKPEEKERLDACLEEFKASNGNEITWEWEEIPEENWWESWKAFFHPFEASPRLWIRPSWLPDPPPRAGMAELVVDPGRAFGTGAHETTRMCLALIDEALSQKPCEHMLDVGCGSGILTVAARLLGCPRVTALDVDALATSATRENCEINKVLEGVLVMRADIRAVGAAYSLVACNILYQIIMGIAPELCKKVAPGGTLLLSGFLVPETEGVERMFLGLGLKTVKAVEMGPWGALVLERPV